MQAHVKKTKTVENNISSPLNDEYRYIIGELEDIKLKNKDLEAKIINIKDSISYKTKQFEDVKCQIDNDFESRVT